MTSRWGRWGPAGGCLEGRRERGRKKQKKQQEEEEKKNKKKKKGEEDENVFIYTKLGDICKVTAAHKVPERGFKNGMN